MHERGNRGLSILIESVRWRTDDARWREYLLNAKRATPCTCRCPRCLRLRRLSAALRKDSRWYEAFTAHPHWESKHESNAARSYCHRHQSRHVRRGHCHPRPAPLVFREQVALTFLIYVEQLMLSACGSKSGVTSKRCHASMDLCLREQGPRCCSIAVRTRII